MSPLDFSQRDVETIGKTRETNRNIIHQGGKAMKTYSIVLEDDRPRNGGEIPSSSHHFCNCRRVPTMNSQFGANSKA